MTHTMILTFSSHERISVSIVRTVYSWLKKEYLNPEPLTLNSKPEAPNPINYKPCILNS